MNEEEDMDSWVPPKSNEDQQKELSEIAALTAMREWIEAVTGKQLKYPDDLRRSLEDGAQLCDLLNALRPCIRKINRLPTPMARLDNLNIFFSRCQNVFSIQEGHLFDLHDLDDLTQRAFKEEELEFESRKRLLRVAVCIFWVAKASELFYEGPRLHYTAFSSIINDQNRSLLPKKSANQRFRQALVATTAFSVPKPNETSSRPPTVSTTQSKAPLFPYKDPDILTKTAIEQLKKMEEFKALKKSQPSESDDEEAEIWQRSFNNWRDKRRKASASQASYALNMKAAQEKHLHNRLSDSQNSSDFSNYLGITPSNSIDGYESPDMLNASSNGDVFLPEHKNGQKADEEIKPTKARLISTLPSSRINEKPPSKLKMLRQTNIHFESDDSQSTSETPSNCLSRSNSSENGEPEVKEKDVVDSKNVKLEVKTSEGNQELSTPEIASWSSHGDNRNATSVDESNLSSGIDEGNSSTTATDSSVDVNENMKIRKEIVKPQNTSPNPNFQHSPKKKKHAPPPPSNATRPPTSPPTTTHRKGPAPLPPPLSTLPSTEKKDPLTPPRQRRSNPRPRVLDVEPEKQLSSPDISPTVNGRHSFDAASERDSGATLDHRRRSTPEPRPSNESKKSPVVVMDHRRRNTLETISLKESEHSSGIASDHRPESTPDAASIDSQQSTPDATEEPPLKSKAVKSHYEDPPQSYRRRPGHQFKIDAETSEGKTKSRDRIASVDLIGMSQSPQHQNGRRATAPNVQAKSTMYSFLPSLDTIPASKFSNQKSEPYRCSACSQSLCQEVVSVALKKYGLRFHVTCFCCSNCNRPLGDGCTKGGLFVKEHRLFCLRCHSADRGVTVMQLGRF